MCSTVCHHTICCFGFSTAINTEGYYCLLQYSPCTSGKDRLAISSQRSDTLCKTFDWMLSAKLIWNDCQFPPHNLYISFIIHVYKIGRGRFR